MEFEGKDIIEIVKGYIEDERKKQAILIDGEWGSGKTYFVEEKLLEEIDKKIKKKKIKKKEIIYLSLYGINSVEAIKKEITNKLILLKMNINNNSAAKIIGIGAKCLSTYLDNKGFAYTNLPRVKDIIGIEKAIIIFDDLERCNADINSVLGYINDLCEHGGVKAIIIANESEIGLSEDIIISDKSTDKLSNQKEMYLKAKEKVVGTTIKYKADLNEAYDGVVEKYFNENEKLKTYLKEKEIKTLICDIFRDNQYNNIRTLIASLLGFEKFFNIVKNIKESKDHMEYFDVGMKKLIETTIVRAIKYKQANGNGEFDGIRAYVPNEFIFVNTYFESSLVVEKDVLEEFNSFIEKEYRINKLALNNLNNFRYMESEEINKSLGDLKNELEDDKYTVNEFQDILSVIFTIKNIGANINQEEFVEIMVTKIKEKAHCNDTDIVKNIYMDEDIYLNEELKKDYIKAFKKLKEVILEAFKPSSEDLNNKIIEERDNGWGTAINNYYLNKNNRSEIKKQKAFFSLLDIDNIVEILKTSKVKDIERFVVTINSVYVDSSVYKKDELNIKNLTEQIGEILKITTDDFMKKTYLTQLYNTLERLK